MSSVYYATQCNTDKSCQFELFELEAMNYLLNPVLSFHETRIMLSHPHSEDASLVNYMKDIHSQKYPEKSFKSMHINFAMYQDRQLL